MFTVSSTLMRALLTGLADWVCHIGTLTPCIEAVAYQRCADSKILRPHQSSDYDHRSASATASAGRCCMGSAVSPRVRDSLSGHFLTGPSRSRVSNSSEHGWDTEVQLTAAAAEHGQSRGLTEIERVRQHYSICSLCSAGELAECAELQLMIRVSQRPRIFRLELSASVRGRCEKLAHISVAYSCIIVTWWSGSGGIQALSERPTSFFQCFDTVDLVT